MIASPGESVELLHELRQTNRKLDDVLHQLEVRSSGNPPSWQAIKDFFRRYQNVLLALPNATATTVWLVMLIYFLVWFLTLPPDENGHHPRISEHYALWPYISCIGAVRPGFFHGVCIVVAVFVSISFALLVIIANEIKPGRWLRRLAAGFALFSSISLIGLSFAPIDSAPYLHLAFTSAQIFGMGNTKFFDWVSNAVMRRWFRKKTGAIYKIPQLEVSRWLRTIVASFAAVPAITAIIGIYGCREPSQILDLTSTCNKVAFMSAIGEWLLSVGWVGYLSVVAYDLYHIRSTVQIYRSCEYRTPRHGSSPSFKDSSSSTVGYSDEQDGWEKYFSHPSYEFMTVQLTKDTEHSVFGRGLHC